MTSPEPPTGTVTFLFTDIEGSTARWERDPAAMQFALPRHDALVRESIESCGGYVFKTVGDAFCAAFADPCDAMRAAAALQRALHEEDWSTFGQGFEVLRVRAGAHTGTAEYRDGDYFGPTLNRVARISAVGVGGQTLISLVTQQMVRGRLPEGASLGDLGEHRLKDLTHAEHIFELVVEGLPQVGAPPDTAPVLEAHDRILSDESAAARTLPEAMRELLEAIQDEDRTVSMHPEQLREVARQRARDITSYRLGCVAEWSRPRYRLDGRFVQMALLVDQGEQATGGRWSVREERYHDLRDLVTNVTDPAVVVLGPPGSGKSTLLRRFELDTALDALRGEDPEDTVTFFVALSQYRPPRPGDPLPSPAEWLTARWEARYPDLPPLDDLLVSRRVVLLLDALNEIPTTSESSFYEAVRAWKDFLADLVDRAHDCRVVFSCRSLDYSAPLSTPGLPVPQVRIDPLTDEQVRGFLKVYTPLHWREIWTALEGAPQLDVLRSPYFLKLLVGQVEAEGQIPNGRAGLFTGFGRQALRREVERDNPLFRPGALLTSRDCRRIVRWSWRTPWDLPERGALIPKLCGLAYEMQSRRFEGEASQVRIDYDDALDVLDHDLDEEIVRAGLALSILDEDTVNDEIRFVHQLVQEYMAARRLAERPEDAPALAQVPWRADEVQPSLAEIERVIAAADPLPPPPRTGWEETTLLAAAMTPDRDTFVRELMAVNLSLAGRCAAQPEVHVGAGLRDELRETLARRSRHPEADLRARVEAALALGRLGDARLERREGPDGEHLVPPLVEIRGGTYPIGRDTDCDEDESPEHSVTIGSFALARFPVTNTEYALFIEAGGYDDERWWDTPAARSWQRGESTADGQRKTQRFWTELYRADRGLLDRFHAAGHHDDEAYALWSRRIEMDDAELDAHLRELFPGGRETEPRFWRDRGYNNPLQPVVGVSWFEARAYSNWLSAQTGEAYRLPTEAEWEAACRGPEGRAYAFGDVYDSSRCNTVETHIRRPAPVGVFPDGDTPEGLSDMTGNTWDWTCSLYGLRLDRADFGYPYDPHDGRQDPHAGSEVCRVARGGSWFYDARSARATTRYTLYPDGRNFNVGFRLAR